VGKDYHVDPKVPSATLVWSLVTRSLWLLRGLVRFRSKAFVGPRVRVRCGKRLTLSPMSTVEPGCRIDALSPEGVWLGPRAKLGAGSIVSTTSHLSTVGRGLRMGRDSSCGEWCYFGTAGGITIGDDVIMGQFVSFHAQQHRYDDTGAPIRTQGTHADGISVGDGTWIGAKATLLDGARVGPGSIIAAGAVVRGEHPAGAVLAGVPARVVRQR
jgi:UDP-3-O-[3-hydroxymyristoyl] glucosamine N-acyltransferase